MAFLKFAPKLLENAKKKHLILFRFEADARYAENPGGTFSASIGLTEYEYKAFAEFWEMYCKRASADARVKRNEYTGR